MMEDPNEQEEEEVFLFPLPAQDKQLLDIMKKYEQEEQKSQEGPSKILMLKVEKEGEDLFNHLITTAPSVLKECGQMEETFNTHIDKFWGEAINLLELFYYISIEAGGKYVDEAGPEAEKKNDRTYYVIVRLHARGLQIVKEVITLLRSGFAYGALSRWRSLHEIVVVAQFIKKHGDDVAKRYLEHNIIESCRAMVEYNRYASRNNYPPYTQQEYDEALKEKNRVINEYGKSFKSSYGWAAKSLGKKKPNFAEIERNVEMDHIRPYYRMSSHGTHANPKSILFNPGVADMKRAPFLAAGASSAGLADPGQCTAISLNTLNATLFTIRPSFMCLTILHAMYLMVKVIEDKMMKAHDIIEARGKEDLKEHEDANNGKS